jgi:6-phosphogluconolactonase
MSVEIEVVDDPGRACAAMLVGAAAGGGHIVLTGGSTPRAAYQEFARAAEAVDLDLEQTHVWFGDERCVPPEDERSNYRLARESLLEPLADRVPGHVHRMHGELGPEDGAAEYERQLQEAGEPRFELLLLGLGGDCHVASLFPDQPTLSERQRLVVGVPEAGMEPYVPRISLTLRAIGMAEQVVFLVSGESKAEAVHRAFGDQAQPEPHTPATLVPTVADQVKVLLDPPAAGRL